MKKLNLTIVTVLFGALASACRPAKMEPPLQYDHSRVDTKVSNITLDPHSPLKDMGVVEMWKKTSGIRADGARTRVAIIGSGVDYTLPDVRNVLWTNLGEIGIGKRNDRRDSDGNGYVDDVIGYDMYDVDSFPYDWHGHETYMMGLMGAAGQNVKEVVGVAPNAEFMVLRYLGSDGRTWDAYWGPIDAHDAIVYAVNNRSRVIYFNWPQGGFASSWATTLIRKAFQYAEAKNVLIVMPAGNRWFKEIPDFLKEAAGMRNVVVVAGINVEGKISSISNSGEELASIAAPAEQSISFFRGRVEKDFFVTTAVAAAYGTGAAALIASLPGMGDVEKVKKKLLSSVIIDRDPPLPKIDVLAGWPLYLGDR